MNYTHGHGKTALSSTSETGHADVVGLLLEARAAVDLMDRGGRTALMLASAKGHVDVVRLLLDIGVCTNLSDRMGRTALMRASANGHDEIVGLLESTYMPGADSKSSRAQYASQ